MKPIKLNPDDLYVDSFEPVDAAQEPGFAVLPASEHTEDKLCTETACVAPPGGAFAAAC